MFKSCMSTVWMFLPCCTPSCWFWAVSLTHRAPLQHYTTLPILSTGWQEAAAGLCAALWHHFLRLWGKCICREARGPPAELPGLPVTAWRHTVVAYPAVKFNPDPLESASLSCPLSFTDSCSLSLSLFLLSPPLSLPLCSSAVSSLNEGSWNTWFLWGGSMCAFVCFGCVFCFCLLCVHLQQ